MPEGHTIHRLALDLARDLGGQRLAVTSPQGRFPGASSLDGSTLERTSAAGKHLFLHFEDATVHVHLGLFGKLRRSKSPPADPRGAIRMRLVGARFTWDLSGPTACELLDPEQLAELRGRLGADPLAEGATGASAWAKVKATNRAIGAVLLDQSVVAGVGNVYRAEILFLSKLHPEAPARSLTKRRFDAMWKLTKELLVRGVKANRIVTRTPEKGERRGRRESLHVYGRTTCLACGSRIVKLLVAARPIYTCETCQPRSAADAGADAVEPAAGSAAPRRGRRTPSR